jgi:hypothetical protein
MHSGKLKSILGLSVAGLLAGLAVRFPIPFFAKPSSENYIGAIFGIALAAYFWIFHRAHSVRKALCLVVTSTVAYVGALAATGWFYVLTFPWLDGNPKNYGNIPAYAMFPGGAVGALCVCGVALFLYCSNRHYLPTKALFCSVGGGLIAILAFLVSPVSKSADPSGNSLFLLWPIAVGAMLGTVLDEPRESEAEAVIWPEISILRSFEKGVASKHKD